MATERLRVILEMVTSQYKKGAADAARATDGITKSGQAADGAVGGLSGKMRGMVTPARLATAAIGAAGLGKAMAESVRAATELSESTNAVQKVFGDAAGEIEAFGDVAAQVAGLSKSEFQGLATATGSLLTNFGFSANQAASEATKLTVRAADLASVFNTDVDQALNAVNSALRGETEPIRKFGVSLNDAAIRARAVELGLADTTSAVDANGKAVAALDLIYEQTAKAQGDFLQTSDDLANAQRIAAAEFENAKARLGQGLTPVLARAAGFASDLLLSFQSFSDDNVMADAAKESLRFGEAIEYINKAIDDSEDPFTALADGLLHIAREGELTEAQFQALAAAAGLSEDQFDSFADIVVAQAEAMGVAPELIEELELAIRGTDDAADGAAGAIGDLGDETEDAANETKRLKDETVNLAAELRKQADPVFKAVSAFQNYQETLQGIDEDGERTGEELLDLAEAVLESESALSELGGGNLEQGIEAISAAIGLTADEVRDLLRELGVLDGTSFTVTGTVVTAAANAAAAGDLDPSIAAAARRAGRASGGAVAAGRSYIVGERGPELFRSSSSGRIENDFRAVAGGGENVVINLNVTTQPGFSNGVVRELDYALQRYRKGIV